MLSFEWDEQKAQINLEKHAVSFQEAKSIFNDEPALLIYDPEHSSDEDRFVLLELRRKLSFACGLPLLP